jgi:glycerol-1-phosphatase
VLLFVDLDGVVYRGAEPVPGVVEVLVDRAARSDDIVYVTNNSMYYRADYVKRLASMGAPVSADRVVSSSRATALFLHEHHPEILRAVTVGASGLEQELADVGIQVIPVAGVAERVARDGGDGFEAAGQPDAVVVGVDPGIDYRRLAAAADCVRAGARFIATNRDPTYPIERRLMPGAGAIVSAIAVASGTDPYVTIGKPEPLLLLEAAAVVGGRAEDGVMIGDGVLTDLAAARAVGARCVLMLTGVTTIETLEALAPGDRPTYVAADATELGAVLEQLSGG